MIAQHSSMVARRHRLYEQLALQGPIPHRFVWLPEVSDVAPAALVRAVTDEATAVAHMLRRGETGDPTFHRFAWLSLSIGQEEVTRNACRSLLSLWMDRFGAYAPPYWRGSFVADRLFHMILAGKTLTEAQDAPWRERYLDLLARHVRHLRRVERKTGLEENDALSISLSHSLGVMALPEDSTLGHIMTPRLTKLMGRLADGVTPLAWRQHRRLLDDIKRLELLIAGFIAKRLSTPAVLGGALATAKNILPLTIGPDGRAAHLPGLSDSQHAPFAISPENIVRSRAHSADLGRWRMDAGRSVLFVDAGHPSDHPSTGAITLYSGEVPVVLSCGCPSALAAGLLPSMGKWRNALTAPAAASTLDIDDTTMASVRLDAGDEGTLLYLETRIGTDLHRRRLLLRPDGNELLGEDLYRNKAALGRYRFHLDVNTRCLIDSDQRTATLTLSNGTTWQLVTNQATLEMETSISAWHDGSINDTGQLVLHAPKEGVRWALRRV